MVVNVEEEWRYKRRGGNYEQKSSQASKSTFAYKVNKQRRAGGKASTGGSFSREVVVKFTKGAKTKAGIKKAIEYISREYELELLDSNDISHIRPEDIEDAIKIMQMNVVWLKKEVELTKSLMFTTPKVAGVSREHALASVKQTLLGKYPDNYFVMAYHNDTENNHVHVVMNMNKSDGTRLNIKGRDFKEMRQIFASNLIEYGYDVKATIKYKEPNLKFGELSSRENRNIYEVVDYGMEKYSEQSTNKTNYLIYRTFSGAEVKIWGKDLESEVSRNRINIGDKIMLKKTGEVKVCVPVVDKQGQITSWKETTRNQWSIEKKSLSQDYSQEDKEAVYKIKLDSPERISRHLASKKQFEHEKRMLLDSKYKLAYEQAAKLKQQHDFKF